MVVELKRGRVHDFLGSCPKCLGLFEVEIEVLNGESDGAEMAELIKIYDSRLQVRRSPEGRLSIIHVPCQTSVVLFSFD